MKQIMNSRNAGIVLVALLCTVLLFLIYGRILLSLNTTFFSLSGDGIQSYFNTAYQIKYDTSLLHSNSMNYPYGEIYIYTQPQILITAPVKFISRHITDISDYTIGIINSLMLISIVLCSIFLYLTFHSLGLPVWISVLAATGISFLSPQIDRMTGHFTLSYCWAIPALIYFLYKFHTRSHKIRYSLLIGLSLFVLATGHIYFVVFYFVVLFAYWLFTLRRDPLSEMSISKKIIFISLQFLIPLIAYLITVGYFCDTATERPSIPYGFLLYLSTPEAVFLPLGFPYGKFLHDIWDFSKIQWEGVAFIGLTADFGLAVLAVLLIRKCFRRQWKAIVAVTDNHFLNVIFWSSLVLLIYSFGIPFIFGLEKLIDFIGPLKQLRTLGRFTWLFFYVSNIVVIYGIWKARKWRIYLVLLALSLLFMDVYFFNKNRRNGMNNRLPAWSDSENNLSENKPFIGFDANLYQAIIPIPFYHMGSEHFNIPVRCHSLTNSCLVSYKTGLPIMAIYSGRASVTYSIKNIALVLEPYRDLQIMQDLPSEKPFLIAFTKCSELTPEEKFIIKYSEVIDSSDHLVLYRLEKDSIKKWPSFKKQEVYNKLRIFNIIPDQLNSSVPETTYSYRNFDEMPSEGYIGNSYVINAQTVFDVFQGSFNNPDYKKYTLSFWLCPVNKDLIAKTRLELTMKDSAGKMVLYTDIMCGDYIKVLDGPWGLIEYSFDMNDPTGIVKVRLYNNLIQHEKSYRLDEMMIRPDSCNLMFRNKRIFMLNNRWYPN